jgi:hypothetical protein
MAAKRAVSLLADAACGGGGMSTNFGRIDFGFFVVLGVAEPRRTFVPGPTGPCNALWVQNSPRREVVVADRSFDNMGRKKINLGYGSPH